MNPYRAHRIYEDRLWQRARALAKILADSLCDPKLDPQRHKEILEAFAIGWKARELNE